MGKTEFKGEFSKQAREYANYRPGYPDSLYQFIYTHCNSFGNAWDCGCGNGQVTIHLAKEFKQVIGTDISKQQLQFAKAHPNIKYQHGPSETIELNHTFDLITAAQCIHWFDREKFYVNVRKHLKQDGILAVFGYGNARIDKACDAIIDKLFNDILSAHWNPSIYLVKNAYKDISFPFEEIPSPEFQFRTQWSLNDILGFFESWSAVQNYKDEKGENPVDLIRDPLARAWGKDKYKSIQFPVFLRLGKL